MTAVSKVRANHERRPSGITAILDATFKRNPGMTEYFLHSDFQDLLFDSTYDHPDSFEDCARCDRSRLVERKSRNDHNPQVHYGRIASGIHVIKHGRTRDEIAQRLDILCFETEAAGLTITSHVWSFAAFAIIQIRTRTNNGNAMQLQQLVQVIPVAKSSHEAVTNVASKYLSHDLYKALHLST